MIIRKKLPRSHKLYEPIRHEGSHPRPVTRRDFLGTGFLSSSAVLIGSSAMVAAFTDPRAARAGTLASDIQALQTACGIITNGAGKIPFICFDLAGGANLNGSEILIGQAGGQLDFLTTAGYGMLGLPGDMLPNSPNTGAPGGNFIDTSLGAAWHSDGAILRGIKSVASTAAMANTNGVGIAAMSQNDTSMNPHNPMYGIYDAGANGSLLTLIGTEPTVSGGNSVAPTALINLSVSPTVVTQSSDITGLVNTGQLGTMFSDPNDAVNVLESTIRISGGNTVGTMGGELGQVTAGDTTVSAALQSQTRCSYVKSTVLVNEFGNPTTLNPDIDPQIVGASGIFTPAMYSQQNFQMTAAVMKMVVNGFAGAGTISLGGFDYHDGTRATGETRNFNAGVCIGACLEYAKRVGVPLMVYVFSDGSLSSTNMIDTSAAGRGKFGWQGDNSSVAASFFLVYNPAGRPVVNPSATTPNQIGSYTAGGAVNSSSSPAANAVNLLVNTVILNYMALHGQQGNFASTIANNGLGTNLDSLIAFEPVVNGVIGG
ncbi:MAG TPA: hypothetical protein VK700_11100 [Steroidobacteraceae bacterium]|jgi:hypothetical protein|nr:hypothetical protein [Steroidobacteraceae bacterium]